MTTRLYISLLTIALVSPWGATQGIPTQFIGVGYDIIIGNPDGGRAAKSAVDPGLHLTRNILQITNQSGSLREATYTKHGHCMPTDRASIVYSPQSYQHQLLQEVQPIYDNNSVVLSAAFSGSAEFLDVAHGTSSAQHLVYHDVRSECSEATLRYKENLVRTDRFGITREFAAAVCALPDSYDEKAYLDFLKAWGTHVVFEVELGYKTLERYMTNRAGVINQIQEHDPHLIQDGGAQQEFLSFEPSGYPTSRASHFPLGDLHYNVSFGTDTAEPIGLKVAPITIAINPDYWQATDEGLCRYNAATLHNRSVNVNRALDVYATTAGTSYQPDTSPLQIPVAWPLGKYGLMQARIGCPGGHFRWLSGWRHFDTEDDGPNNQFTDHIDNYMKGTFAKDQIVNYFCVKDVNTTSVDDMAWPGGSYCILRYDSKCPAGFYQGDIYFDNEDGGNSNSVYGTLPDGVYNSNTKMFFCCRDDGPTANAIRLPTQRNFVLLRYKGSCQVVKHMRVTEMYIRYDDEDTLNSDSASGAHPYDNGGSRDHRLFFCHYERSAGGGVVG